MRLKEQVKHKESAGKDIMKIRADINEIEKQRKQRNQ